jgi:ADP-ribose pyrophosphatase YjhB (NUDIX family)
MPQEAAAELAEALVFRRDQVLLIRRQDVPVWTLPGGHRDAGESAAASCAREVFEETGLQVRVVQALGCYRRPWWLSGGRAAVYLCEPTGGELCPGEYEAEARFCPVGELPSPILYWYPAIIAASFAAMRQGSADPARPGGPQPAAARGAPILASQEVSPTLGGFLRSLADSPGLWLPLGVHALRLYLGSRFAQWRAHRRPG